MLSQIISTFKEIATLLTNPLKDLNQNSNEYHLVASLWFQSLWISIWIFELQYISSWTPISRSSIVHSCTEKISIKTYHLQIFLVLLIGEVRNVVKPGFAQSLTSDVRLIRGDPSFPTRPRAYWLSGKGKEEEKTSRNFFRIQHQSDRRKWQSFHALTLWQVSLWWMFGGTLHREEGKSQQVWFPDCLESQSSERTLRSWEFHFEAT